MNTAIKLKTCKVCESEFEPFMTTQKVCSQRCALDFAFQKAARKRKKESRAAVRNLKARDRSHQLKLAQAEFNKFIRLRDAQEPCISCQRDNKVKMNAGHFKSVGSSPELRFDEDNCHKQCEHCNNFKSGNQAEYEVHLINKIGVDRVEILKGPQEAKNYSLDEIIDIKKLYRSKAKELQTQIDQSVSGI